MKSCRYHNFVSVVFLSILIALPQANSSFAKVFDPISFTLNNGLQVIVVSDHRAPAVAHMLWYKVGSADDPQGKSGLAHFLEHLMFKGTRKYGPGQASKIIAKNGGSENAFTGYDYTAYYQIVTPDNLALVMDIESDRMSNLVLDEASVQAERDVVLEERNTRTENSDQAKMRELVTSTMFLAYPYRIPIIGWKHEIKRLDGASALEFYRKWYVPNNAVLIVAGDVYPNDVRKLAERYYGPIARGPEVKRNRVQEPPHVAGRRILMASSQVGLAQFTRRYLAPSYQFDRVEYAYPLQLLSDILGNSTSSRLYQELVVNKKLAVSVGAWYSPANLGPSVFGVYASPKSNVSIAELEDAIDNEIQRILDYGVTEIELEKSKTRLRRSAVFARDSVTAPARIIGNLLLSGQKLGQIEAWPENIAAVTRREIKNAAEYVFKLRQSVTAILTPKNKN